jgi:putative cardiolipin synthase
MGEPVRVILILAFAALLNACATLRSDVPRFASHALPPDPRSLLGQISGRILDPAQPASFRLLESGRAALSARLGLAERAGGSLDLQYYLFHADTSGQLLVDALLRAADRGVRVRVLLDDVDTAGSEQAIVALDAHPNIQIRLYNPFRTRGNSPLGRAVEFLGDKERLNRRMHNKLFVADNQFGITGGRNIGDEYFQVDSGVAFRDLDVLAAGRVVVEMSAAFDTYWNSEHSVPARAVPKVAPRERMLADRREALEAHRDQVRSNMEPYLSLDALQGEAVPGLGPWTPDRAELLLDDPGKTAGEAGPGELPITRLFRMGQDARQEMLIASPYFVPGRMGADFLGQARRRGVRVRVLTNSLAANDVGVVHAGYARYRLPLLRAGVELHELKPLKEAPGVRIHFTRGSSRASLHSKAMVVDRARAYIGSMNLDPRSALLNTEGGLVIHGADMAGQVARFIEAGMSPERSYQVRIDPASQASGGKLIWLERRDGRDARNDVEPGTSPWQRFLMDLLSGLPIEEDL